MQVSILCGGKSSRMQSEKGLALYKNKPFIEHIIDAVLPITSTIQLITNSSEYDYLKYDTIKDVIIDKGPMGGIYTALLHSDTDLNLILSCDIPLISTTMLLELIEKYNSSFDVSIFEETNRVHPLIGIYSKNVLPMLKNRIDANELKMMHFISNSKHQLIWIEDENRQQFQNINSLLELQEFNAKYN
ncbi:molybdenum cofactor guanylyltransferase [Flavobacterium sp.]|uniref:molybdenum cofactor guanylyltransferase n=1 Tax=Flavobacterium sp. TaxID=239 RepID=UPI00286E2041|nr:molybdenum cofactor guanylyltransferase [Flavobacterium sp.]